MIPEAGKSASKFTLVIPFHNRDYKKLFSTVQRWEKEGMSRGITHLLLCHNGPTMTEQIQIDLQPLLSKNVMLLTTPAKGIGAGYRLGIEAAKTHLVILSASDLL